MKYVMFRTKSNCPYAYDSSVKEMFVDFAEVERITGRELADIILRCLCAWGLTFSNIRGQCYDGASNMAGSRTGCSTLVQQKAPKALYTHCAAHQLNLAVVSACKIQDCRNAESFIGKVASFFLKQRSSDCWINVLSCCAQQRN